MIWAAGAVLSMLQAAGGGVHLVVVTGLGGEPEYRTRFAADAAKLVQAASTRWDLADSGLVVLTETGATVAGVATARATRDGVIAALSGVARRAKPGDVFLLILMGHGSQQGEVPTLNLPGPDLTASDLAASLGTIREASIVVVNAASASGGFLSALSAPRRVVITATKTGFERNATQFGTLFVKGLAEGEADTDKDQRVSMAEAYQYARREVVRAYEAEKRLLTEHAQLDDNGDGKGTLDLAATGDGMLARTITVGLQREPAHTDPAVAPLIATRRRLEAEIAALRGRKATMDSTSYQRDLELLLVSLAETNQAIRAAQGKLP